MQLFRVHNLSVRDVDVSEPSSFLGRARFCPLQEEGTPYVISEGDVG
jgi:hypothetical protein